MVIVLVLGWVLFALALIYFRFVIRKMAQRELDYEVFMIRNLFDDESRRIVTESVDGVLRKLILNGKLRFGAGAELTNFIGNFALACIAMERQNNINMIRFKALLDERINKLKVL